MEPRKTFEEDFWTRETRTGQQVAQFLDCYMMMMISVQKGWVAKLQDKAIMRVVT
jgi:hypothetical protein